MAKMKKKYHKQIEPKVMQTPTPNFSSKRIIASGIDWVFGGIISGIPSVVFFAVLTKSSKPLTSMYQFESMGFSRNITILVSLICLLCGFCYYVIVPWKIFPGQTLGKHWLNLKIVHLNNQRITLEGYCIRQFLILIFIEGAATATSTYIKVLVTTISRFYIDPYLRIIWFIVTLGSLILLFWSKKHLALHDILTKTTVIDVFKSNNVEGGF